MSSNIVSNVTITGNLLVQGLYSNVASLNTGALSGPFLVQGSTTAASTFKIASGKYHTAFILADGTVRTVGNNGGAGQGFGALGINVSGGSRLTPVPVFGISSSATAVACGHYHNAVLLADGTVRTFGYNNFGQLGVGDTTSRQTPTQVLNISTATGVACGAYFTAVLLANGTVRTFGNNGSGQLGVNDTTQRNTPVTVLNITSATAIACGDSFTALILADGTVRTFGSNLSGNLGVNDGTDRSTPVQVFGISSSATAVACGGYMTAVLLADGTLRTFGQNASGNLGVNNTSPQYTPVQVFGISSSATAVACSQGHTAVLLADGTIRVFGDNTYGQLGIDVNGGTRQTPVQVTGLTSVTAIATSRRSSGGGTAVLLADGSVRTFGRNANGQLGVGDTASRLTPVQVVTGFSSVLGKVAGGRNYTAVVMGDGTVRMFGRNNNGQLGLNDTTSRLTPVQVFGISSSATAVAGGHYHTAVLLSDGTVRTFGNNDNGNLGINVSAGSRQTPVQVFGISSSATAVAGGYYHTAVLLVDGTVRTFGGNNNGQLGINVSGGSRETPVTVLNITSATAIASGLYHTAVILADGTVSTFGYGNRGQLGNNNTSTRQTPVQVFGISSSATAVACGWYHTAVILADGTVRTFGGNFDGQLGVNDTTDRQTPVTVLNITSATAVACGRSHTAVLLADGTARTFGNNSNGRLGIGVSGGTRQTPVQVFGISSSATAISCGNYTTIVLLADGSVRTVGRNSANGSGQLGVADTVDRLIPVKVGVSENKVLACGSYNTAILLVDGTVRTFGGNGTGQLGVNDRTNRSTPVQVFGISSSATSVACGRYHTAVLLSDGTIRTFGRNDYGQLGDNTTVNKLTPVQVFGISSSATAVACGWYHTAVILADGTVRIFGDNSQGQLGIFLTAGTRQTPVQVFGISSSAVAIAGGTRHTAVLLADGTVRTFGSNYAGELGINVNGGNRETPVQVFGISSSATAVACGSYTTVVLLADGTVRTIGSNGNGQLGINVDGGTRMTPVQVFGISSSATAIACGQIHTAVVLANGTVRMFGRNLEGQLGIDVSGGSRQTPVQVFGISSSAVAVAAGGVFTAVLLADGTVRTFGSNDFGALGINVSGSRQTPVQVISRISSMLGKVAGGTYYSAVLMTDGTVRMFGRNDSGQLGDNTTVNKSTPVQVFGISSSATVVACGNYFTAVLLADGTVRTFGRNDDGQLGLNDTTNRLTPVQVFGISSSAVAVATGNKHAIVLLADGTLRSFGSNQFGQLGINITGGTRQTPVTVLNISTATAVACGGSHTAVLLANGTVRTFGYNIFAQLGNFDDVSQQTPVQVFLISSSAVAVACGRYHTVVLLANGTVRTFGSNTNGELGINVSGGSRMTPVQVFSISSSATAIAGGLYLTSVLLSDGSVRTFGRNDNGNLGINATGGTRQTPVQVTDISTATAVASGSFHTVVLLPDGTVRTFGRNNFCQLGVNDTTSRQTPVQVFNITTAVTPGPITFITNATAIVIALSSASTPAVTGFLLSTAAIITYPFIQFPALNLGPVTYPQYQLELTTDYARKLTTSTWTIGSDERLKTDIETANVDRCVEIVQNLDLKRFAWNFPDGSQPPDSHSLGWIAQEFAQFFPNSVNEAPAHGIMDFKNLNSDQIIKVMWGALKKLRADLKSRKSSDSELSTAGDNASPTPE
jgi:alpha-tubulin suppressor-like RCC1 family protein